MGGPEVIEVGVEEPSPPRTGEALVRVEAAVSVSMLVPIPDGLTFENAACLAVASLTAGGLARAWPLKGREAVVWGAVQLVECW